MAKREVQISEPGCTLWRVQDGSGETHYEVKCGIQKVLRFETEAEAIAHYQRWAPEVRHDRMTFGDD